MKLRSIEIKNFRCIKKLKLPVEEVNGTYTFALIGINESGKSSFLEAISLVRELDTKLYPKDYTERKKPVQITLHYDCEEKDEKYLRHYLSMQGVIIPSLRRRIKIQKVTVSVVFDPIKDGVEGISSRIVEEAKFEQKIFEDYVLDESGRRVKKLSQRGKGGFNVEDYFKLHCQNLFWNMAHRVVFWKPESKYLISEEIDLDKFAKERGNTSIPLRNCFELAEVEPEEVLTTELTKINDIQGRLGRAVTEHINAVWPSHLVTIKFQIHNKRLAFLVEDKGKVPNRSKTMEQRVMGLSNLFHFF